MLLTTLSKFNFLPHLNQTKLILDQISISNQLYQEIYSLGTDFMTTPEGQALLQIENNMKL